MESRTRVSKSTEYLTRIKVQQQRFAGTRAAEGQTEILSSNFRNHRKHFGKRQQPTKQTQTTMRMFKPFRKGCGKWEIKQEAKRTRRRCPRFRRVYVKLNRDIQLVMMIRTVWTI
jgi:hypothetical protein